MSTSGLVPIDKTSFVSEQILERRDLQAALRDNIAALGDELLVISEEFAGFSGANRRIDLLCIDREARLVVLELKRTEDGGHLELQALRYAAMVSAMTFDELVDIYAAHLRLLGKDDGEDARIALTEWLDDAGGEDAILSREVRIVLVASGFDREITTTVLWLNDVFGLDIRCVRLTPYKFQDRILLDIQPVIPLPEAEELTVRLKQRQTAARVATASTRDFTKYALVTKDRSTGPLPKRRALLELVHELHRRGVTGAEMGSHIQNGKFLSVPGVVTGDELRDVFVATHRKAETNLGRWFLDAPLHDSAETWVLSKQWGHTFLSTGEALLALRPELDIALEPIADNGSTP